MYEASDCVRVEKKLHSLSCPLASQKICSFLTSVLGTTASLRLLSAIFQEGTFTFTS